MSKLTEMKASVFFDKPEMYEGFGIDVQGKTKSTPLNLPSEELIKKFLSEPEIIEKMQTYVRAFGRKAGSNPLILAGTIADIDDNLNRTYKAMAKQNFVGNNEAFDAFSGSEGYDLDIGNWKKQQHDERGIDVMSHFDGDSFDAFQTVNEIQGFDNFDGFEGFSFKSLLKKAGDFAGDAIGKYGSMLPIPGAGLASKAFNTVRSIGNGIKKDAKDSANAVQVTKNLDGNARLATAQSDAITAGLTPEQVKSIVDKATAGKDAKIKEHLDVLDTVVKTTVPEKILTKVKDYFQVFKDEQTKKEIAKNTPVLIGILALAVVLTYILARKS